MWKENTGLFRESDEDIGSTESALHGKQRARERESERETKTDKERERARERGKETHAYIHTVTWSPS